MTHQVRHRQRLDDAHSAGAPIDVNSMPLWAGKVRSTEGRTRVFAPRVFSARC